MTGRSQRYVSCLYPQISWEHPDQQTICNRKHKAIVGATSCGTTLGGMLWLLAALGCQIDDYQ